MPAARPLPVDNDWLDDEMAALRYSGVDIAVRSPSQTPPSSGSGRRHCSNSGGGPAVCSVDRDGHLAQGLTRLQDPVGFDDLTETEGPHRSCRQGA